MNQTKTYTMPMSYWVLLGACALAFIVAQVTPVSNDLKLAPGIFTLAIAIIYLTSLSKIVMDERGHIVLSSAFKKIHIDAADVTSIEYNSRSIALKHRHGKIDLPNLGTPTQEFLHDLKQRNPAIVEEYGLQLRLARNRTFMIVIVVLSLLVPLLLVALILAIQNGGMAK